MANLYKKTYPMDMPDGAEIITRRGKPLARWVDGRGNTKMAPLHEDGERITCRPPRKVSPVGIVPVEEGRSAPGRVLDEHSGHEPWYDTPRSAASPLQTGASAAGAPSAWAPLLDRERGVPYR